MPSARTLPTMLRSQADPPLDALRALMAVNDHTFHLDQARELGVSADLVRAMRERGEITRVHQAVYRSSAAPPRERERLRAALLAAGDGVVSHASAAKLLGLPGVALGRPEITVGPGAPRELDGVRVHRSRELGDEDRTIVRSLPSTTSSRTIIDLAARLPPTRPLRLVDEAIWGGQCERAVLHAHATALSNGRSGVHPLVEVTAPGADERFRSMLERDFGRVRARAALPPPLVNATVRIRGRLLVVDNLWIPQRLALELHGLRFHDTPRALEDDAERANLLVTEGYRVLVATWNQLTEHEAEVVATLRRARAQRPAPAPAEVCQQTGR